MGQCSIHRCYWSVHGVTMRVGNYLLHLLTSDKRQILRVDLADWEGYTAYEEYDNFKVGSAQEKYNLSLIHI